MKQYYICLHAVLPPTDEGSHPLKRMERKVLHAVGADWALVLVFVLRAILHDVPVVPHQYSCSLQYNNNENQHKNQRFTFPSKRGL